MDTFNGLPVAIVTTTIRREGMWRSVFRIDRVCDSMQKAWAVVDEVYNRFLRESEAYGDIIEYMIVHNNYSMIDGFEACVIDNTREKRYFVCEIERTLVN